jgi:hypothetical protein
MEGHDAVIVISPPVFGLRFGRSFFSRNSKFPNPDSVPSSARYRVLRISSKDL